MDVPVGHTSLEIGSGEFEYALLKPLPPVLHQPPPISQLHAGIGLRRQVEPSGTVPVESWVALIANEGRELSLKRIVWVVPTKESGLACKVREGARRRVRRCEKA